MSLYESNYIRLGWLIPGLATLGVQRRTNETRTDATSSALRHCSAQAQRRSDDLAATAVSEVPGDCPLHLRLHERSRYTTTLTLTYLFDEAGTAVADPDLQIRIYHDARLAEVQACARWHRHAVLESMRSELARSLGERWLRNMMLNKWLDYCVERGHRFDSTALQPPSPEIQRTGLPAS